MKGDYDYDYDSDAETVVYDFDQDEEQEDENYFNIDESEIFKYTREHKSECKKLDSISTDDLYNELCVRMSELDEIVVLLSVDKYKSLLDFERERKEFEEYKKAEMEKEMEKLVREKERERKEFEEYKKAEMEKEMEKLVREKERERKEFEEYKKAEMEKEMEKLVREKERERKEFEEYKKAEMEKEMEKLSIELKKEKETFVNDISIELYKYENKPAERIPKEFLRVPCMIHYTDDLYPVLYFKSYIQVERSPSTIYLHTLYYNTGARISIKTIENTGFATLVEGGGVNIESLENYKDKYIFTQNMVDIIYKTFGGDKTTFILNKNYFRWSDYRACPNENDVDRLINTLKVLQREREEKLRTLV
jgi:hypothetical protein